MAVNVGIDTLVGALPMLGDLFDFAWKSNRRNVQLARSARGGARSHQAREHRARAASFAAIALVAVGVSVLAFILINRSRLVT